MRWLSLHNMCQHNKEKKNKKHRSLTWTEWLKIFYHMTVWEEKKSSEPSCIADKFHTKALRDLKWDSRVKLRIQDLWLNVLAFQVTAWQHEQPSAEFKMS